MSLSLSLSYCSLLYTMYDFKAISFKQSWDSSAGTVNRPWALPPSIIVLFLAGPIDFLLLHSIQSGSVDHPLSCSKCTGVLFPTTVPSGLHTDHNHHPAPRVSLGAATLPAPPHLHGAHSDHCTSS